MGANGPDWIAPTAGGPGGDPTAPAPSSAERRFEPGSALGRFVITQRLGAGGMGIVLSAVDPILGRPVALKLLRSTAGDQARERLLREAKALARLSHENVLTVYEAGEANGEIFLVMELVSGKTLGGWLADRLRSWREIVSVFARAGRGLEAAHAAGLVHRDFKPENVLIGDDGRVRVSDFGLAAAQRTQRAAPAPVASERLLSQRLTETGVLVGTPAFMAPEQHDGGVDPRTDQFAFCVALYQALFDCLPFEGETTAEYLSNVNINRVRLPAHGSRIPRWLWRVVTRGLRAEPARRFASMTALVRALERPRSRSFAAIGFGAAAVIAIAVGAGSYMAGPSQAADCAGAADAFAAAWSGQRHDDLRAAFARTRHAGAANTAATVASALDARARDWRALRVEVCRATQARSAPESVLSLKLACLDDALTETRALVDLLLRPDNETVTRAPQAVGSLSSITLCDDARRLAGGIAPPDDPTARAEIAAIRARLAESGALYSAGRFADSLTAASAAVERARRTDYSPVLAEGLYRQAAAMDRLNADVDGLRALYSKTIAVAGAARHDRVLFDAWLGVGWMCMHQLAGRCDPALGARMARAALSSLGPDDRRQSRLLDFEAWVANAAGDQATARRLLEQALAVAIVAAADRDEEYVARAHGNLANLQYRHGEDPGPQVDRARAIYLRLGGPYHAELAPGLDLKAAWLGSQRKWQEAEQLFRQALGIRRRTFGEFHSHVAASHNNISFLLFQAKEYARCIEEIRMAVAIYYLIDPDSRKVPAAMSSLGEALEAAGQTDRALAAWTRTLVLYEKLHGPDHRDVAGVLHLIGRRRRIDGNFEEALASLRRAARIYRKLGSEQSREASDVQAEIERAERRDASRAE